MTEFGKRLRTSRKKGGLTQEQVGRLLGEAMGDHGFSGAAVSDWERGVSKIHADNRIVLVNLVRILHQVCGITTLKEANELLEAGNYRALDAREQEQVFPKLSPMSSPCSEPIPLTPVPSWAETFSIPAAELQALLQQAQDGPPPVWPRMLIALINRSTSRITATSILNFLMWIWIWLLAWILLVPSLRWPFDAQQDLFWAMVWYAIGTLILPALIAALTRIRNNPFWVEKGLQSGWNLRLYTYQGAGVGFHVGYFLVFLIVLLGYNLGIPPLKWAEWLAVLPPLGLAYASARLVPYNILQAYKDLHLSHGAILFVFIFLGPIWAFYFYGSSSMLTQRITGLVFFLLAATILSAWTAFKAHRVKK